MPPSRPTKDRDTKEARVLANRYEIVKRLGSGNFGTAFLCKDRKCNNENKVLKEISVGDLKPDETFDAIHEAKLQSSLDHPGIVKFHDSFIDGEFFCIITEYCEGGDLDNKISEYKKSGKSFDEKTVLNWIIQLILALQYMHSRRVLHRDLKTRNIFIKNNLMKIGDFGISRILMGTTDMASTFTGTLYYMSPEVLKHEGYNSKSDVWSIGCILYELCTGEHAFTGQGLMAVMYKIVEKDPPDLPSSYSKELNEVFKKTLTKDPDKRPSATDVIKFSYISGHMTKMKETLTDEFRAKHNINPETADREASELARLLRENSHLDSLRSTMERSSNEDGEDLQKAGHHAGTSAGKKLTARERLRQKKMQEADKRAQDLKNATKIQLVENKERKEKIKTSLEKTTLPAWRGGDGEGVVLQQALTVRDPRQGYSSPRGYRLSGKEEEYHGSFDEDEEKTLVQQTIVRRHSERSSSRSSVQSKLSRSMSIGLSRTLTERTPNTMSMTIKPTNFDDRPITPMKDLMVYNRNNSSLDFKDGIPENPELANTYYGQFSDFDVDIDDDDDDDDIIVVTTKNGRGGEEGEETSVVLDDAPKDDEEDLINCLEMALDKSGGESTFVSDDTIHGAFGPHARETKIKHIRAECVKILGEEVFKKAYEYLKTARNSKKEKSEKQIMEGLRRFVKNPSDCFMVDQLLFLEEQAKLS